MLFHLRNFFIRVKRAFDFAVIGYSNHDWDWQYLAELMIFKMHRMRIVILDNDICMEAKQIHDEILECENKFQAVLDDKWCDEDFDAWYKKHKQEDLSISVWSAFMDSNPEAQAEFSAICKKHNALEEEKFNEAFDYLRDNVRKWWD